MFSLPLSNCCGVSVRYNEEYDNFYCTTCGRGQGNAYYNENKCLMDSYWMQPDLNYMPDENLISKYVINTSIGPRLLGESFLVGDEIKLKSGESGEVVSIRKMGDNWFVLAAPKEVIDEMSYSLSSDQPTMNCSYSIYSEPI